MTNRKHRWNLIDSVVFTALISSAVLMALNSSAAQAQELRIRAERAPYFVGETIVLEVEAIEFKIDPAIEIKNSEQANVSVAFANSGRSTSTQIFQSGGKLVRSQTVRTTFSYRVEFTKPGRYTIGPFEATEGGTKYSHPEVTFVVSDIETTTDMKVEIELPQKDFYPGQQVPLKLRWIYSGNPNLIKGLTIRNELFERFRFKDEPMQRRQTALPITTSKGVQAFPATFTEEEIDGKKCFVGTIQRTLLLEKPEVVTLPPTFVSFQKITGRRRSNDIFESFFEDRTDSVPFKGIGEPVSFTVKPFPNIGRPDSFDGAVGSSFKISTSTNRNNFRTGDPLTMQINIEGQGNIESIGVPRLDKCFSTEDFDWPTGELPGVTKGPRKQFSINMRVKNETLTEIPAVEFSYFDPDKEEYVSVHSKPIPIEVSKGEVVSSKDVVGQISSSSDSIDVGNGLDLAIETDVDKLVSVSFNWQWMEYSFYVFGIVLVGVALLGPRSMSPKKRAKSGKKQLVEWRKELNVLLKGDQDEAMIGKLSDHLRKLQSILGRMSQDEGHEGRSTEQTLDELIGDMDKVAYRQSSSTKDEVEAFIQKARVISGELL